MRKGILKDKTKISIPWFDTDGNRQYTLITINEDIDARKMYKGIRKFVRETWGTKVNRDWLANVPIIVNSNDPGIKRDATQQEQDIEAFIDRMELKDEDEDQGHTTAESEAPKETR